MLNAPHKLLVPALAVAIFALGVPALAASSGPVARSPGPGSTAQAYVPAAVYTCPITSTRAYVGGPAYQYDRDNPVRPAYNHADKNLALRGYTPNTNPALKRQLVRYPVSRTVRPPQFATLFRPYRVPAFVNLYRVYDWIWAPSPNPGTRGAPLTRWSVTALGLRTTPGESLRVPVSGYSIGAGMAVIVLFADEDSITLRYTRQDSSAPRGYTVFVDNICTDPNLLALYRRRDQPNGPRYVYVPPTRRPYSYKLPTLAAGQVFGRASGAEVVVAITDTGTFMDPRSCGEWWQIRPNYTGTCPIYD